MLDCAIFEPRYTDLFYRYIKAATTVMERTTILQRDLDHALLVPERKRKRSSLRSTVACKSGGITVNQIWESAA